MFFNQCRHYIFSVRFILLLPLLLLTDQSVATTQTQPDENPTLLVVGDSLSAGYGLQQHEGWVSLLKNRWASETRPINIVNAAISGETTDGGLARLPRLLEQHQPTHVLIELGGNDGLQGHPVNKLKANLVSMVELAKQAGAEVFLQDMQIPSNYGKRYTTLFTDTFDEVADEQNISLIPFFLQNVALNKDLMQQDGIHPNKQAQPLIADYMENKLKPLIFE